MEQETILLPPVPVAKKVNNKRSFSSVVESHKSNPLIQAARVTSASYSYLYNTK